MQMQQPAAALKKENISHLFTTGFALFSMFFGAGNLIFPLLLGLEVGANWWAAVIGLGLTAVIVPFLGLASMIFFDADYKRFFGRLGVIPGFLVVLLLQLILGPFGVIPRLVTLMHAIAKPYLFDISLSSFSLLAVAVIFLFSFKRQNLIHILGVILTPILLISLASLFISGVAHSSPALLPSVSVSDSFIEGVVGGYNTMDLIASFLFATIVLPHFQSEIMLECPVNKKKALSSKILFTSIIAATLLFLTYIGLAYISAHHSPTIANSSSEGLLSAIALKLLGSTGGLIATVAIVTACLTTAITLTHIFADYLRSDLCQDKISPLASLLITLAIAGCLSNLGFAAIAKFLGPILQVCYPGLIVLTLLNTLYFLTGFKTVKTPVFFTFLVAAIFYMRG